MYTVWFLIPIVAILVGGFTEWLKFKEKQLKLGSTTDSLAGNMDDIINRLDSTSAENQLLRDRIKNLEAIVTTQMWDDSVDSKEPVRTKPALLDLSEEVSDEDKAKILARRIRH
jgi:hypothetical protein